MRGLTGGFTASTLIVALALLAATRAGASDLLDRTRDAAGGAFSMATQGPSEVPPVGPAVASGERLIVMSYNIHLGGKGLDGKRDFPRLARILVQADVVGLQEIRRYYVPAAGGNQAKTLAGLTGMHYAFAPASFRGIWRSGNAILSKRPIVSSKIHRLPFKPGHEPRVLLEADLGNLTVFVTHLSSKDGEDRLRQSARALEIVGQTKGPVVLLGDFNATAEEPPIRIVAEAGFTDAGAAAGPTFNASRPRRRIDFIFVRGAEPLGARVLDTCMGGDPLVHPSDHRPLETTLVIPLRP